MPFCGHSDSDGTMVLETRHEYDLENRLTSQTIRMGDTVYTESYAYDDYDRLDSMTAGNGDTITPEYDDLNRVETVATPEYDVTYTYTDGADVSYDEVSYNGTTALVSGITYTSDSGSAMFSEGYLYDSLGRISRITDGSQGNVYYVYDSMGQMTEETSIEEYFYILNLQGDVVAICDENCNELGSYIYNAWGEITTQSGTIAQINPIRYRGYYYDSELEMYYLQSRYYDPQLCRYINADSMASTGQGFLGFNMFGYCNNDSVNYSDDSGHAPHHNNRYVTSDRVGKSSDETKKLVQYYLYDPSDSPLVKAYNYITNTDPDVVLEADFFAFYKGVPVIKAPIDKRGFSFGFILLGDQLIADNQGRNTLNHEYGHFCHMQDIGIPTYAGMVVVPSLTGVGLNEIDMLPVYYYDQPWEYIADEYGGVDRGKYSPETPAIAGAHNTLTQIIGAILGG